MSLQLQTRVRNKKTGELGTVSPDMGCCGPEEVPVVYDETTAFLGTYHNDLDDLGPENAKPDLVRCGAGQGDKCCIFLVIGSVGPECQRYGLLRHALIFKKMNAKRHPAAPFPKCFLLRS